MVAFSKFSRNALAASVICYMAHDFNTENNTFKNKTVVQARRFRAKEGTLQADSADEDPSTSQDVLASEKAFEMFKSVEIGKIVDVMNDAEDEMKKLELDPLPVPSFVVLGEQSAGKSRLIETIAGEKFNYVSGGTASRRPTRITFKKDTKVPHGERWWFIKETDPKTGNEVKKRMDVGALQLYLQGIHADKTKFKNIPKGENDLMDKEIAIIEKDEIVLECRGTEYDIVITDLPGMMRNKDETNRHVLEKENITTIDDMVKDAFSKKDASGKMLNRILLIDEAKEIEKFDVLNDMVTNYYQGDYSRVTLVRTKLDNQYDGLAGANGGNLWLRGEARITDHLAGITENVSRFDRTPGIKFASLSCPHETRRERWGDITTKQFREKREECNKTDLEVVQRVQADLGESPAENERVLKTVGFQNFVRRLEGDVKELFMDQVRPVVGKLRSEKVSLNGKISNAGRKLEAEKECTGQKETGRMFAKGLGILVDVPDRKSTKSVQIMKSIDKSRDAEKITLLTSNLTEDLKTFAGDLSKEMIFTPAPSNHFPANEKKKKIGGGAEAIFEQTKALEALRNQQFVKVKRALDAHLAKMEERGSTIQKIDNEEGFGTTYDKLSALTTEVTIYMNTVEPYFDGRAAAAGAGGGNSLDQNKGKVKEIVQSEGMSMLMHHITVVGLRVKNMFEQAAERTRTFMTRSLALNTDNPQINEDLVGPDWAAYTNTPIDREQVFTCVDARYKEFLHEIFLQFMDDYKQQLKYMLHDPFTLLMGSESPEGTFYISEEDAHAELKKRLAMKDQAPSDAGDSEKAAEFQQKMDDEYDTSDLKRKTSPPADAAGAGKEETTKKATEVSGEASKAKCVFTEDHERHIDMESTITNYFGGENASRWTKANAGDTVQKLAGLLFKAARAKIADSLSPQIHRYFFNKLAKNTFHGQKDEGLGSFQDFMSALPDQCFVKDDGKIKQLEAEKKDYVAKLSGVEVTLSKFEQLLK